MASIRASAGVADVSENGYVLTASTDAQPIKASIVISTTRAFTLRIVSLLAFISLSVGEAYILSPQRTTRYNLSKMATNPKKGAEIILGRLRKEYPEPTVELDFSTPFELLVASRLAAQNRDETINTITPALFRKYRGPRDYIDADESELQEDIKRSGFFRQKAKALKEISQVLVDKHNSKVPDSMNELVALPGIGRKTANVILSFGMGKAEGIVVDVHHIRVLARLGLTKQTNADKIEEEMIELIPKKDWIMWSSAVTLHGRYVCTARKPKCSECVINDLCPSAFKIEGAV